MFSRAIPKDLEKPASRHLVVVLILAVMSLLTLELRLLIDIEGVLDIDAINFGLSALRFDLLEHQPHPPGYPGYVVLLKLIHLLAPWLGPLDIAKWACRLCSVACVPVAWWVCFLLLKRSKEEQQGSSNREPLWRPLAAALIAAVHPLLWYYGSDGQSHAAEALGTLVLIGAVLKVKTKGPTLVRCIALAALFGLSGSLRPMLPLLLSPLLIWLMRGRPLREWLVAGLAGGLAIVSWFLPLVAFTGGWDVYGRTTRALVQDLYFANYSFLGARTNWTWIGSNLNKVFYGSVLASLPFLCWSMRDKGRGALRWPPPLFAFLALSTGFYILTFTSELGYFAGIAAASTMVPASWPERASRCFTWRAALVIVFLPSFMIFGPESLPAPFPPGSIEQPTLSHIVGFEKALATYRKTISRWTSPNGLLVLSDNVAVTHTRLIPVWYPKVISAVHIYRPPFNRTLDNWVIYSSHSMKSLPTRIPLEAGPPVESVIPLPVARVLVGQDASTSFLSAVAASRTCPPLPGNRPWPDGPVV